MSHSIYAYAWDLLDEKAVAVMRPLQTAGVDSLTVALSYHAGKFIAPWHSSRRVIFPEDGTVYFEPQRRLYRELVPQQAACTRGIDLLRTLKERFQMPVYAWTVLLHNTRLGERHLDCTVRNAYGDRYPYSLCPAHPDVAHYALALCSDIATRDIDGIKLETPGYLPYAHGFHHEFAQVPANPWLENQLGLCFCEHCSTRARQGGLDAEELRRAVIERVDEYLASSREMSALEAREHWLELLAEQPPLARFLGVRCEIVEDLLRDIRAAIDAVRSGLELRVIPTVQQPHEHARFEGSDLSAQSRIVDRLEVPLYQQVVDDCVADVDYIRQLIGADAPLSAIVRPGFPDMHSEAQLHGVLQALAARNITDVSFYNLGLLRPQNHRWIRETLAGLE